MHLKRLEIVGFKSFTERTTVTLGPGISAVVGPNGCGKSNIIDAIRWVMGEQSPKLLRARAMEDLLFNGSQNRPPAAVAEVTLTLARDDAPERGPAEISVTRRLHRAGDSEYLINRIPARLKDVVRFFIEAGMGTRNYSIIEQEKVGRLVDAPPEERRLLIDEAAGVTRYKEQRRESERRLESAGQNLVTVSAMLSETSKRLAVVSKAAAKAARWRAYRDELKSLELGLSARRFLELGAQKADLAAEEASAREDLTASEAAAAAAELRIDEVRLRETGAVQALEEAVGEWHQSQGALGDLTKELEINARESELAVESGRSIAEELESISGQDSAHQEDREIQAGRVETLSADLGDAESRKAALSATLKEAERLGEEAAGARSRLEAELARTRDARQRGLESQAGEEGRIKILQENLRGYRLERERSDEQVAEAEGTVTSCQRRKRLLAEDLEAAAERLEELEESRDQRRRALDAVMGELGAAERQTASLAGRLDTLENLKDGGFGWYPEGVKALLKDPDARGLVSPVAEALRVPDGYEEAAEAFLGERLGWILAESREAALDALRLARERSLGRCGLISREDLGSKDLMTALLGPVELIDELPETIGPKTAKARLTRQGDYLGPLMMAGGGRPAAKDGAQDGAKEGAKPPKGGSRGDSKADSKGDSKGGPKAERGSQGAGLLARLKEIQTLAEDLDAAESAKSAIEDRIRSLRGDLSAADEALTVAQNQRAELASELGEANSKLLVAQSEVKGLIIRRDSLASEIARTETQIAKSRSLLESAAEDREKLKAELDRLEAAHREASAAHDKRASELEEVRSESRAAADRVDRVAELLEGAKRELDRLDHWRENLQSRRSVLARRLEENRETIASLAERKAKAKAEIEGLPERVGDAERRVVELRGIVAEIRDGVGAAEEAARTARHERERAGAAVARIESGLKEADYGLARLREDLLKDWRVVLAGPGDDPEPEPDPEPESESGTPDAEGDDEAGAGDLFDDEVGDPADSPDEAESAGAESPDEAGALGADSPDRAEIASADSPDRDEIAGAESSDQTRALGAESPDEAGSAGVDAAVRALDGVAPESPEAGPGEAGDLDGTKTSAETWEAAQAPPERLDPSELAAMEIPDDAEVAIARLRERLASMGEVNHTALEEEAELKTRHAFHQTQRDDLVEAIGDLRDSIERVNQTCLRRFNETFEQADQKFREIFPVLFEGGEGWLSLNDESDPLESGVEIHVHPPGKRIMVMRSLSGGEKTLTSLCLIFALYLIKPSPFCLLDEADAPLDEANIDRFNRLLRNLSESSQIIMVTHNKRTMQISGTLYGVTMETPGVSRLVSVNLSEAEVLSNA